jgi:hypothetical protein
MKRLTYTSLLLEARDTAIPGRRGFPPQSERGDEKLCPRCLEDDGSVPDDEGRLLCVACAEILGLLR